MWQTNILLFFFGYVFLFGAHRCFLFPDNKLYTFLEWFLLISFFLILLDYNSKFVIGRIIKIGTYDVTFYSILHLHNKLCQMAVKTTSHVFFYSVYIKKRLNLDNTCKSKHMFHTISLVFTIWMIRQASANECMHSDNYKIIHTNLYLVNTLLASHIVPRTTDGSI